VIVERDLMGKDSPEVTKVVSKHNGVLQAWLLEAPKQMPRQIYSVILKLPGVQDIPAWSPVPIQAALITYPDDIPGLARVIFFEDVEAAVAISSFMNCLTELLIRSPREAFKNYPESLMDKPERTQEPLIKLLVLAQQAKSL
jgi:hypothetical protein